MGLICKVKFQVPFKDGNIDPRTFKAGEVVDLYELIVKKIIRSGGEIEILEKRVPKPQKAVEG